MYKNNKKTNKKKKKYALCKILSTQSREKYNPSLCSPNNNFKNSS